MSATKEFHRHRARHASLTRFRPADDLELISERQRMNEAKLVAAIQRALAAAPPLTDSVRSRILGLLS